MSVRVLVALGALGLVGCDGGGEDRVDAVLALTGDADGGAAVFANNCVACHGADGTGGVGADLTAVVPASDDAFIVGTVLDGTEGMQSFSNLTDQAIADLLAYLRREHG